MMGGTAGEKGSRRSLEGKRLFVGALQLSSFVSVEKTFFCLLPTTSGVVALQIRLLNCKSLTGAFLLQQTKSFDVSDCFLLDRKC